MLLGGCSAEDKLGSETQSPQISSGSTGIRTNLPIWSRDGTSIHEMWRGKYRDGSGRSHIITVTANSISIYDNNGDHFFIYC